jgi:hypothetical protein
MGHIRQTLMVSADVFCSVYILHLLPPLTFLVRESAASFFCSFSLPLLYILTALRAYLDRLSGVLFDLA